MWLIRSTSRSRMECGMGLWTGRGYNCRSAQESLKKKGFTVKDGVAHVKVKGIDDSRYLDQTQAYRTSQGRQLILAHL